MAEPLDVSKGTAPNVEPVPAPPDPTSEKKRTIPWLTLLTFGGCLVGMFSWFKETLEPFEQHLVAFRDTLARLDIVALTGAFIDGMRAYAPAQLDWWTPWGAFFAGFGGMWSAMTAGGGLAIACGVLVIGCGLALSIFAFANMDNKGPPNFCSRTIFLGVMLVVVFSAGVLTNLLIAGGFGSSGLGGWVAINQHALSNTYYEPPTAVATPEPSSLAQRPDALGAAAATPAPAAHGDYTAAGAKLAGFAGSHWLFVLETLVVGILVVTIVSFIAIKFEAPFLMTVFVPFMALGVLSLGAGVAWLIDHLLVLGVVRAVIWAVGLSSPPVALGILVWFLEKSHLSISTVEAARKLFHRSG
jgi:hypothetical protein